MELEQLEFDEIDLIYKWRISSRWIKYEQTIDPETEIWSKPFIGALEYQNIAYLKSNLQSGTVILNSQQNTFEDIIDEIAQDFINRGRLNRDYKEKLKSILLSQHRDHLSLGGAMAGKKAPISELFSSNLKHSRQSHASIVEHFGSSIFKRNVTRQHGRNDDAGIESEGNVDDKKQFVKFYVPSHSSLTSFDNQTGHHHSHHHNKHLRSTLNLLKNPIHHSKSKHSDLDTSTDIESFAIMIGNVDFLDKPGLIFKS